MKLICNGDSWTFGSEIVDPKFGGIDWKEENDQYRKTKVWPWYLAKMMHAEVTNLGYPADDNGTILQRTICHVSERLASGDKPEDLFVIVGWSSPERNSFWYRDNKFNHRFRVWPHDPHFERPQQRKFWRFYVEHLWCAEEYMPRFVLNALQLQTFLNSVGVRWLAFNAFYQTPTKRPEHWQSLNVREEVDGLLMDEYLRLDEDGERSFQKYDYRPVWDQIDPLRFYRKDQEGNTFKDFIDLNVPADVRMNNWHPSPTSHEAWAGEVAKYVTSKGLI